MTDPAPAEGYIEVDVQAAMSAVDVPGDDVVKRWVAAAVRAAGVAGDCEVSVRFVDQQEGSALNEQYRDRQGPTNVLSFPAAEMLAPDAPRLLGDIVLCVPVILQEAEQGGIAPADHFAHLLVHGTLHLLGHDHAEAAEAAAMEALETRILGEGGIADPYAA